jgi:hypothetical protein
MAILRMIWFCDDRGFGLAQSDWGGPPRVVGREAREGVARDGFASLEPDGLLIGADGIIPGVPPGISPAAGAEATPAA